jgi:hypothetical protein
MWHVYTVVYSLAIKKNEIMSFSGKQMKLESMMVSEMNQTQKDEYLMLSLIGRK